MDRIKVNGKVYRKIRPLNESMVEYYRIPKDVEEAYHDINLAFNILLEVRDRSRSIGLDGSSRKLLGVILDKLSDLTNHLDATLEPDEFDDPL